MSSSESEPPRPPMVTICSNAAVGADESVYWYPVFIMSWIDTWSLASWIEKQRRRFTKARHDQAAFEAIRRGREQALLCSPFVGDFCGTSGSAPGPITSLICSGDSSPTLPVLRRCINPLYSPFVGPGKSSGDGGSGTSKSACSARAIRVSDLRHG